MGQMFCAPRGTKRKFRVLRPGSALAVPVTTAPLTLVWQGTPDPPIDGGVYATDIHGNKWVDSTQYLWLLVVYQGYGGILLIREQDYASIGSILVPGANWAAPWILYDHTVAIRPQA